MDTAQGSPRADAGFDEGRPFSTEPGLMASIASSCVQEGPPGYGARRPRRHGEPKLLDRLSEPLRSRHYSRRSEQAYCLWVRLFIYFHRLRHPAEMAEPEINGFLTHLAFNDNVSASTQNQALSALLFLYRHVLGRRIGDLGEVIRARKPKRLPVVMTQDEVKAVLGALDEDKRLMASLMYGSGLRLMECLRLRVQDIDSGRMEVTVRDGKGNKDRVTMLPESLARQEPLREPLAHTFPCRRTLATARDGC